MTVVALHCNRCGYEWARRGDCNPVSCPNCKSYHWNETVQLKRGPKPKKQEVYDYVHEDSADKVESD